MGNENIEQAINNLSTDLGEISSMLNRAFGAVVEELSGIRNEIANLKNKNL